ncbi:MAG: nuclear transport factor 2 family protein [Chitinophagales bacterium]
MKYFVTILLLFVSFGVFAQKQDTKSLEQATDNLDKALLKKDTVELKMLLSNELSYGHSNGWIESKREVIDDLFNGKLIYKQISRLSQNVSVDGNVASVRSVADLDVVLNGKPVQLKLSILQVWIWKNKNWVLFARQSVKI